MATFEVHVFDSAGRAVVGPPVGRDKITTSGSSQATPQLTGTANVGYVAVRIKADGGDMRYEIGDPDGSTPTADQTSILLTDGDWEFVFVQSGTIISVINKV